MQFEKLFLFLISLVVGYIGVAQAAPSTLQDDRLVRGCYLSVDEYLTNSPSFVDSFYLTFEPRLHEEWEGTLSRTPRYGGKQKKIKDIWGFSDGYNAYVFHQDEYFKLENDSSGIYFYGYDVIKKPSSRTGISPGGDIIVEFSYDNGKRRKLRYTIHEEYGYFIHPNMMKQSTE